MRYTVLNERQFFNIYPQKASSSHTSVRFCITQSWRTFLTHAVQGSKWKTMSEPQKENTVGRLLLLAYIDPNFPLQCSNLFKYVRSTMLLISDGNSHHVAHAWGKTHIFFLKIKVKFAFAVDLTKCLTKIELPVSLYTCAPIYHQI